MYRLLSPAERLTIGARCDAERGALSDDLRDTLARCRTVVMLPDMPLTFTAVGLFHDPATAATLSRYVSWHRWRDVPAYPAVLAAVRALTPGEYVEIIEA